MSNTKTLFLIDRKLRDAVAEYGLPDEAVSFFQILNCIRLRINAKGLYDPVDREVIHTAGDALGIAFKCDQFRLTELVDLVLKHSTRITVPVKETEQQQDGSGQTSTQRRTTETAGDDETSLKRPLTSEPDVNNKISSADSGTETARVVKRVRRESTISVTYESESISINDELLTLTTDSEFSFDSFSSVRSSSPEFDEFSLFGSDNGDQVDGYTTGSDIEVNIVETEVVFEDGNESHFFADSSDDTPSDSDTEDMGYCDCGEAGAPNRFCEKCFHLRFGWLSQIDRSDREPPKLRKRRLLKQKNSPQVDSRPVAKTKPEDAGGCSALGMCTMCETRPITASIAHGTTSHVFACYKCSRMLQEKNMKCPICRRTIDRVYRIYVVQSNDTTASSQSS